LLINAGNCIKAVPVRERDEQKNDLSSRYPGNDIPAGRVDTPKKEDPGDPKVTPCVKISDTRVRL
jgi:hypothetical protein